MILATQYYRAPFPEKRYWKEDLDKIKASGLNAIQLWVIWGWVEAEPGIYNFEDYDELFDLAAERGLGVILSTIAEIHPYWIHRLIPDSHMVDHMGRNVISSNRVEVNQGLTPGGCTDNPEVLRRMGTFLQKTAEHFCIRSNMLGWDLWNELRWSEQSDGLVCFCPHTLKAFRNWLLERYNGLEGLNKAWKRKYVAIEDVMPGKLPDRPYQEMMDFEAFIQWRCAQHMRFRYNIVKKADPIHLISAHGPSPSIGFGGWKEAHAMNRGNDWDFADIIDGLGCSHFPFWSGINDTDFGIRIEAIRSAIGNKVLWVSELQGGSARNGFDTYPSVDTKPQQRWVWNSFGRGAKAVIFWCWRDEVFGRECTGFGLSGMDGLADQRLEGTKKAGHILKMNSEILQAYRPDNPKVGIWFDPNTYNLEWAKDSSAQRAYKSIFGYASALERINVPYTIVESAHLDVVDDLKLLVMPWPLIVPEAAAEKIYDFVEKGGTLLIEAEAGSYDTCGLYRYPGPDRTLSFNLGLCDLGRRMLDLKQFNVELGNQKFTLKPDVFYTPLSTTYSNQNAVVSSTNEKGEVLALDHRIGDGRVITIGTFVGIQYFHERYKDFEEFIRYISSNSEVFHPISVESTDAIQWRTGKSGDNRLLFITNISSRQNIIVKVPKDLIGDHFTVTELTEGIKIFPVLEDGVVKFEFEIEDGGYCILKW